jgi:Ca2+-binding EF-hand superfamily protein
MSHRREDRKLAAAIQIQSIARGHATRKKYHNSLKGSQDYDGRHHHLAVGSTGWSIHYAPPDEETGLPARSFWHHTGSGSSVWEEPAEALAFREATSVDGWCVFPAPNGEAYWFNSESQMSVSVEPEEMRKRRLEYNRNTAPKSHSQTAKKVTFKSPGRNVPNSPYQRTRLHNIPTITADTAETTVVSVLSRLRILSQDEDPGEAFKLFALTGSENGRGGFIPVSVFAASIQALCPGVRQPLALATARVFDRGQSGLVGEKIFRDIMFDRSELSRHRIEAVHEQVLILLDELRDVLATTISENDGTRGYSASELKRHFNNMKVDQKHKGISRGRFVQVMKELDISNDSDTLHALVDEFDHGDVGYVSFESFCAVIKRDEDHDHFHERHRNLEYENLRRRPQPSKRTLREARSVVAKFQRHFHTRTSSIDQLHEVFDAFDRYGDGHIAGDDFVVAMRHFDFSRSNDALQTVVDMLDPEGTGYIAWHTFFDHLALEASSGLTPRCLAIDKHGVPHSPERKTTSALQQLGGLSPRHHGRSSGFASLKMDRPIEYPDQEHDDDYDETMGEAYLLLQVLEGNLVKDARKKETEKRRTKENNDRNRQENRQRFRTKKKRKRNNQAGSSKMEGEEKTEEKTEEKKNGEEHGNGGGGSGDDNIDSSDEDNLSEYEGKSSDALVELTPVELLAFLVDEFDSLDVNGGGAVSAKNLYRYLKRLRLTSPLPKTRILWGCVSAMNTESDGTIQLYDWLSCVGSTALDPLSADMLSRIRTIYRQNLTDSTGQHAFREMLVHEIEKDGTAQQIVSFDKYLSLIATLPRQPLSSVVARYLWDHLSGGSDRPHMTWTEFLVEMMENDDRAKLNATLRGMGAKGLGMSMADKAAKSPRSKATGDNGADALKNEVEHVWRGLQQLFHAEDHEEATRWNKMDAVRRQFFSVRGGGMTLDEANETSARGLDHQQFVRLLRNMSLSDSLPALRHVTMEFDIDDSHSINWMEFVAGILERPPSKETGAEKVLKKYDIETRKAGRKILKALAAEFIDMEENELAEKVEELFHGATKKIFDGGDIVNDDDKNEWKIEGKGLGIVDFGNMITKIIKKSDQPSLLNPMTGKLHGKVLEYLSVLFDEDNDGDVSTEEFISCLLTQSKFKDSIGHIRDQQRLHEAEEDARRRREERERKDEQEKKEHEQRRMKDQASEDGEVEGGAVNTSGKRRRRRRRTKESNDFEEDDMDYTDEDDQENDEDDAFMAGFQHQRGDEDMPPQDGQLPILPVTDSEDDDDEGPYAEKPEERQERKRDEKLRWMMTVSDQNEKMVQQLTNMREEHHARLRSSSEQNGKIRRQNGPDSVDWEGLKRVPDVQSMVAAGANLMEVHEKIVLEGAFMNVGILGPRLEESDGSGGNERKYTRWNNHKKKERKKTTKLVTTKLMESRYDEIPQRSRREWSKILTVWERHLEDIDLRVSRLQGRVDVASGSFSGSGLHNSVTGVDISYLEKQPKTKKGMHTYKTLTAADCYERRQIYMLLSNLEGEVIEQKRQLYRESDYWFERDASRQSARLRFLRNFKRPPQRVYESLLEVSGRFRKVDGILKRMKGKLVPHAMKEENSPSIKQNGKTSSPLLQRKRYVPRKETHALMTRIQQKEKILRIERRNMLDLALADQGRAWPPTNVIPPQEVKSLRARYIQHGLDNAVMAAVSHSKDPTQSPNPFAALELNMNINIEMKTTGTHHNSSKNEAMDVAYAMVLGLATAERHCRQKIAAKMVVDTRTQELEQALEMVGLDRNPVVTSTKPYNDYLCRSAKGNTHELWIVAIRNIIHAIERKKTSRTKTLKRVFEAIDFKNKGYINGRAVLRFATGNGPSRVWIPKVVLSLMQGKKYRQTLMKMTKVADTNNDGVVDVSEFTAWALPRWTPELPNTELAQNAVIARLESSRV